MFGFSPPQSAINESRTPPRPAVLKRLHTESGMVPDTEDSCNVKVVKFEDVPIASGTVPVKELL